MRTTITRKEAEQIIAAVARENELEAARRDSENRQSRYKELRVDYGTDEEDWFEPCEADEAYKIYIFCEAWSDGESARDIVYEFVPCDVDVNELDGLHDEFGVYINLENPKNEVKVTREQIERLVDLVRQVDDREHCKYAFYAGDYCEVDTYEEAEYVEVEVVDYDGGHDYGFLRRMLQDAGIDPNECKPFGGDHLDGCVYGYKVIL